MSRVSTARERSPWGAAAPLLGGLLLVLYAVPVAWLLLAQPPGAVLAALDAPFVVGAARNTLVSASISTALATLFGVPLAYWLARARFRGRTLVTAVVAFPLVLPPVVSGMVLVGAVGSNGLGGLLGVRITGTLAGVVLAQTFVASPFVVLTARSAFERVDAHTEEAARTLGATEWGTFRRVTLPLAWRGILAGVTLAFARAAGEFGATLMLAYYPRTLPVQIWATFSGRGLDAAFPVAVVLLALASAALVLINLLGESSLVLPE
ncbi:ABC transporter permease [Halosimplex carlsbadense 2-9-1]|uniref:ABC transporter permease n=1 Tax=Halosimplex carlsbadense 2-9-1 TaxID=797114 RepID=M0CMK4_9EURY|nr:ABC transporter permease [Halosimplex carlsbadense]ELZ23622.1 ABC transporter permease [Halosimplex carlsbadense 2-9-1]